MGIHAGLENIIPKAQFNELTESVYDFFAEEAQTDPLFRKIFDKVTGSELYAGASKADKGEEMLAYLAEKRKGEGDLFKHQSLWNRLMAHIRNILARIFGQKNIPMTRKDIEDIVDAFIQSNYQKTGRPGSQTPGRRSIRDLIFGEEGAEMLDLVDESERRLYNPI